MALRTDYIAETDEAGHIVWVWQRGPGETVARPVRNPGRKRPELDQGRFFGANREAISDWLTRSEPAL